MNQPYAEKSEKKEINRVSIVVLIIFLISGAIVYKLFNKTILEHSRYIAMAKNQYYIQEKSPSKRGIIYASDITSEDNLSLMATNIQTFTVNIVPKNVQDKEDVSSKLGELLEIDKTEIFDKINNDKPYIPPIKKKINKEIADKIIDFKFAGVYLESEDVRYYPEDNLASHILGFVNAEGNGNYGVENYYDDQLRGRGGMLEGEKDTFGRIINVISQEEVKDGTDLVLTIEKNVQYIVEQKLKEALEKYEADNGSVTIIEPSTGKVIAMAGYPDYNPNTYNEIEADNQSIFLNPVISKVYEPGSIFKPIVMSFAVNEGKIEPDTEEVFSNYTVVQGYEIHTAQDKAFGRETMTQVLENSDNVAMVWISDQVGTDSMYKYIMDYGFGSKLNIDLTGETSGSVTDVSKWRDINRATISFGQGISVTPLQIISAMAAIANNGKYMKPYVVDKMMRTEMGETVINPEEIKQVISEDTAQKISAMMVSVVEKGHGKKAGVSGYKVAGKTGTAQIPRPASEGGGYYEDRHTGSFAGFFPADNPRFAMLVRIENPKNTTWAEESAAPTFGEIARWILEYYQIPPSEL